MNNEIPYYGKGYLGVEDDYIVPKHIRKGVRNPDHRNRTSIDPRDSGQPHLSNRIDSTVAAGNAFLLYTLGFLMRISSFRKEVGIYFVFCGVIYNIYAFFGYIITFINTQTNSAPPDEFLTFIAIYRLVLDITVIAGGITFFVLIITF
jgi:hypothetical protein